MATLVILAITVLVFALEVLAGGSTRADVLLELGASFKPYVRRGEYWRLVMPMFLHAGLPHLLLNGFALYALGSILERIYGYGRFLCLYVGAGVGGSLLSVWRSNDVAVGASGAILGMAGAIVVTGYLRSEMTSARWRRISGKLMIGAVLADLALGVVVPKIASWLHLGELRIDNWAHLGGLVSGMALAAVVPPPRPAEPGSAYPAGARARAQPIVALPVAIVVLAMAFTAERYRTFLAVNHSLEEAARLRSAHHDDQAVQLWQQAVRRSPNDERPHEQLGLLYLERKRFFEAIREYSEALRCNPDSDEAQLGLGLAYQRQGDLAKSRELLDPILQEDPSNAEAQEALADLFARYSLVPEAVHHYQQALRLDPEMAEAHNNLAWLDATVEDLHFRNPGQALEHARRAVELSRWRQPEYIDTLAEALYANQQYAEAVKVQAKALQLAPDNPEYKDHMARYRKAAGA